MATRFAAEKEAGSETADVLLTADLNFPKKFIELGLLTTFGKAGLIPADYPREWIVPDIDAPLELEILGIGYNTELVKPSDAPKNWSDLLDPKWKGMIVGGSPATLPVMTVLYGTVKEISKDPDFLKKLRDQEIQHISGGMVPTTAQLGAGEYAVMAISNASMIQGENAKGAPVEIVYPDETTGSPFFWVLNAQSKYPNAQKLFAQYIISPEGNEALFASNPNSAMAYTKPDMKILTPDLSYYDPSKGESVLIDFGLSK